MVGVWRDRFAYGRVRPVFLVLARLLAPEDFGVVAAATVIISFSQVFSDAGLGKALIQRQDRVEESANVVFWLNLGIGLIIVAIPDSCRAFSSPVFSTTSASHRSSKCCPCKSCWRHFHRCIRHYCKKI